MKHANYKALTRFKNKIWLDGDKADFMIGSYYGVGIGLIQHKKKCSECGVILFFADTKEEQGDLIKKSANYICPKCVLESDAEINSEQKEMLQRYINEKDNREIIA